MPYFFVLLGLLPSFAWLWFFLKEDVHPEPKKMIAKTFFAGALAAVFAVAFQFLFLNIFKTFRLGESSPVSFLTFSAIEEIFKFLAAYLLVRKSRFFDEPIDAMIYTIAAALGFAALENVAVASSITNFSEVVTTLTLRFVGATLLHALSSGVVGYYWAKGIIGNNIKILIFKGIVFASLLHMIFNYLIIISKEQLLIYPTIFLIIIALFVFWDFEKVKTRC
jgi:RsiW-degrading membrane proteinase PrsW (M82 family)